MIFFFVFPKYIRHVVLAYVRCITYPTPQVAEKKTKKE